MTLQESSASAAAPGDPLQEPRSGGYVSGMCARTSVPPGPRVRPHTRPAGGRLVLVITRGVCTLSSLGAPRH